MNCIHYSIVYGSSSPMPSRLGSNTAFDPFRCLHYQLAELLWSQTWIYLKYSTASIRNACLHSNFRAGPEQAVFSSSSCETFMKYTKYQKTLCSRCPFFTSELHEHYIFLNMPLRKQEALSVFAVASLLYHEQYQAHVVVEYFQRRLLLTIGPLLWILSRNAFGNMVRWYNSTACKTELRLLHLISITPVRFKALTPFG